MAMSTVEGALSAVQTRVFIQIQKGVKRCNVSFWINWCRCQLYLHYMPENMLK